MRRKKEKAEKSSDTAPRGGSAEDLPQQCGAEIIRNNGIKSVPYASEHVQVGEAELVMFRASGGQYALEVGNVKEILRYAGPLKVPDCPNYVEGVIPVRNRLLAVVNLAELLGTGHGRVEDSARIIVVDAGDISYGIVADKVTEVARVPRERICKPGHAFQHTDMRFIRGFVQTGHGKRVVMVLNPYALVSANELDSVCSAHPARGENGNVLINEAASKKLHLDQEQIVVFQLNGQEYGVTVDYVCEVNTVDAIYRLPGAPVFIEGMASLRGDLLTVLNLRTFFGMPSAGGSALNKLLVVEYNEERIGIMIDSVSEVVGVNRNLLESADKALNCGNKNRFVRQIGKLNGGNRTILIIDPPAVLDFIYGRQQSEHPCIRGIRAE